ncbi:MAG: putative beta-lysine N-acetyltransferase [Deltaproteobacteria bacterium]|nr:putative beta-lysine N-acetyltransferase [Deltaproteobacteria bacterium]
MKSAEVNISVPKNDGSPETPIPNERVAQLDALPGYGQTLRIAGNGYEYEAFFSLRNRRIRVTGYNAMHYERMMHSLKTHALQQNAGKIFIKAPINDRPLLCELGFSKEATISGYFNGRSAVVMSVFLDTQRQQPTVPLSKREAIVCRAQQPPTAGKARLSQANGVYIRIATEEDAQMLAALFRANFASYPFPVFDAAYVHSCMKNDVVYMVAEMEGTIAAVASAETVPSLGNAEMTDFATLHRFRGNGLGALLLNALEKEMAQRHIHHLYTLARASSPSINRIFGKAGYTYTGTLIQNCHISGDFEDMNCWCKTVNSAP